MIPYPAYKSTDLPWLPNIPEHWDVVRAKNLFTRMNRPVSADDEVVTCFRDGEVTLRKKRRLEGFTESLKEIGYQGICPGDLVIHQMDAFAGAIGVSDSKGKGTPVYICLQPKGHISNWYYAYLLRYMAKSGYIKALYRGIRERSSDFRWETMCKLDFPVPVIAEQEQIVRYLDSMTAKINKLIRAKKKQIALLQEQRQAIINHAVTKGLDPNVEMKDSGIDWIGEIPKDWIINKISWLFGFIGSGTTPPNNNQYLFYENGTIPWINSGDLYQNDKFIQKIARKVTTNALMSCSALKQYPKGTIVTAMYGASIGNMGITMESACCNQACCCLSMPKSSLSTDFAFYLLSSCKKHWVEQSYGGGQQNISQDIIKSTRIPIPPKEEQIQIVSYLDVNLRNLNKLISQYEHIIVLLQEYKNSLISSVVTGQIDVRNIPVEDVIPDDLIPEDDPTTEIEDEPTTESEELS